MKISDLFSYKYGVNLELINCEETTDKANSVNFVARTSQNNGVVARVRLIDKLQPQKAGTLSLAVSGSVLSCFVQTEDYYSGRDLYVLTPKIDLTFEQKLFYATAISKNKYRYSFGRAANKTFPNINIPSLEECNSFIGNIKVKHIKTANTNIAKNNLDTTNWHEFSLSDLFDVLGTKTTKLDTLEQYGKGKYPYVTTQASNNGIAGFYNYYTEEGNVLTIDSAVLGYCAYQKDNFSASDHVEKLVPKFKMNKYIALFIVTLLNREVYRYSYGRKSNQIKIKNTSIKLPAKIENDIFVPDWQFVECYIKTLPYSDRI